MKGLPYVGHREIGGEQDRYMPAFTTRVLESRDKEAATEILHSGLLELGDQSRFPLSLPQWFHGRQ